MENRSMPIKGRYRNGSPKKMRPVENLLKKKLMDPEIESKQLTVSIGQHFLSSELLLLKAFAHKQPPLLEDG